MPIRRTMNSLAGWAQSLSTLGYRVWSDVTRLIGGEEFWDDIEEAIRKKSARLSFAFHASRKQKRASWTRSIVLSVQSAPRGWTILSFRLDSMICRSRMSGQTLVERTLLISVKIGLRASESYSKYSREIQYRGPVEDGPSAVSLLAQTQRRSHSRLERQQEPMFANSFALQGLPEVIRFFEFDGEVRRTPRN